VATIELPSNIVSLQDEDEYHNLLVYADSGVGKTVFDAITARDYTVVQGFTLVIAVGFVLVNLFTDVVYTFLDPRVRVT